MKYKPGKTLILIVLVFILSISAAAEDMEIQLGESHAQPDLDIELEFPKEDWDAAYQTQGEIEEHNIEQISLNSDEIGLSETRSSASEETGESWITEFSANVCGSKSGEGSIEDLEIESELIVDTGVGESSFSEDFTEEITYTCVDSNDIRIDLSADKSELKPGESIEVTYDVDSEDYVEIGETTINGENIQENQGTISFDYDEFQAGSHSIQGSVEASEFDISDSDTVSFEAGYRLQLSTEGGSGQITGDNEGLYNENEDIQIEAEPGPRLEQFQGVDCSSPECSFNIQQDKDITAEFTECSQGEEWSNEEEGCVETEEEDTEEDTDTEENGEDSEEESEGDEDSSSEEEDSRSEETGSLEIYDVEHPDFTTGDIPMIVQTDLELIDRIEFDFGHYTVEKEEFDYQPEGIEVHLERGDLSYGLNEFEVRLYDDDGVRSKNTQDSTLVMMEEAPALEFSNLEIENEDYEEIYASIDVENPRVQTYIDSIPVKIYSGTEIVKETDFGSLDASETETFDFELENASIEQNDTLRIEYNDRIVEQKQIDFYPELEDLDSGSEENQSSEENLGSENIQGMFTETTADSASLILITITFLAIIFYVSSNSSNYMDFEEHEVEDTAEDENGEDSKDGKDTEDTNKKDESGSEKEESNEDSEEEDEDLWFMP